MQLDAYYRNLKEDNEAAATLLKASEDEFIELDMEDDPFYADIPNIGGIMLLAPDAALIVN